MPPTPGEKRHDLLQRLHSDLLVRLADRSDGAMPPRHIRRLLALLEGVEGEERRRSAACEAAIALKLLSRGCSVSFEVPTHDGRTADFDVRTPDARFFLHVKRWTPSIDRSWVTLRVPLAVRALELIRRPYLVGARWPGSRSLVARFVEEGSRFLEQASVGDEWVFRDDGALPSGGLRILAPWPGERVVLTVGLDAAIDAEIARLHRFLRKGYGQFGKGQNNVIWLCGGTVEDERLVDTVVLGSHIERWDLFPPRGHRVAHGRSDDGFWSGERYSLSRAVAWCPWSDARGLGATRLWFRTRSDADTTLRTALGA